VFGQEREGNVCEVGGVWRVQKGQWLRLHALAVPEVVQLLWFGCDTRVAVGVKASRSTGSAAGRFAAGSTIKRTTAEATDTRHTASNDPTHNDTDDNNQTHNDDNNSTHNDPSTKNPATGSSTGSAAGAAAKANRRCRSTKWCRCARWWCWCSRWCQFWCCWRQLQQQFATMSFLGANG